MEYLNQQYYNIYQTYVDCSYEIFKNKLNDINIDIVQLLEDLNFIKTEIQVKLLSFDNNDDIEILRIKIQDLIKLKSVIRHRINYILNLTKSKIK